MNRKKYLTHPNGRQYMIVDCDNYEVELTKSEFYFKNDDLYTQLITFRDKATGDSYPLPAHFNIDWDEERDGGRLEIKFRDRWGCHMIFKHYGPTDVKGMFDFIARGYEVKVINRRVDMEDN